MMMKGVLLLGIWLTAIGALFADEQKKTQPPAAPPGEIKPAPKPTLPPGNPAEQIKTLISQYDQASEAFRRQIEAARSNADQLKLYGLIPDRDEYARLLIGIAEKNPKDRAAFEALIWVVRNSSRTPDQPESPFARAQAMLARDHVTDPEIGLFCMALRSQAFDRAAPGILRQVLDKNPHKQAQATAAFALAKLLRMRADWVAFFKKDEAKQRAAFEKAYGKEAIAELQHGDPEALRKESEMLLERLVTDKDYKNAETLYREKKVKLSELADRELFELRHLLPGKPAPEIAGEDIDGKAFKLSDYRGKVVLLDFWGHW